MPSDTWKHNKILLKQIIGRQLISSNVSLHVCSWNILRTLITRNNGRMLHQAANTLHAAKSCSAIIYDSGYLVIKDDANCLKVYNLNGLYGQVVLTHTLPLQGEWKDRDFGTGPVRCLLRKCAGFKPCLYYITSKSLFALDIQNGTILESVELPDTCRYADLFIDDETHTLAVGSVKNQKGRDKDILIVFCLFDYNPLVFQQLLEIRKSVYGHTLTGAEISQGCLLTMHKNHRIKMYSLSAAKMSTTQEPPVLFVITSFHHQMFMGANPFHVLNAERYNKFWVSKLKSSHELSKIGTIEEDMDSFEPRVCFHPDSSPRVIVTNNGSFRLYDIHEANSSETQGKLTLRKAYSLFENNTGGDDNRTQQEVRTASGRVVRRPIDSQNVMSSLFCNDGDTVLLAWDYEDDMKLLAVIYAQETIVHNVFYRSLTLDLIDSVSGERLRRIPIEKKIRSVGEPLDILMRMDGDIVIVSLVKHSRVSSLIFRFVTTEFTV